jgi:hypothetical protein
MRVERPRFGRRWHAIVALAALVAAAIGPASPAKATADGCAPDYNYSWSNTSSNKFDMVPYATAPGGHTLSITLTAGASVSITIGGSLETSQSVLIASAKESINASITGTLTASVSYSDSWTVPSGASYGELHAGAKRYFSHWSYGHDTPACTWLVTSTGNANMPWQLPAFWSVTHP